MNQSTNQPPAPIPASRHPSRRPNRRDVLATTAALLGAAALSPSLALGSRRHPDAARKRALRLAHLTDTHIQPELKADQGVGACLRHCQSQADKPDLILTGGDCVMDSFEADQARTSLQWDLWKKVMKSELSTPVRSALGNHDIWGWNKGKSKTTGAERGWGKNLAVENLGIPNRYYSFDQGGWHFAVLDSVQVDPDNANGYLGFLDDEQFAWLEADLAKTASPTLLLSHIPILSVCSFTENTGALKARKQEISGGLMHIDSHKLRQLFLKNPHVKLCLSGHIHLVDRVEYDGVTYLCNGAVSGSWWKGAHHRCQPGYAMLDLFDDGTFTNTYETYGWKQSQ
jgi:3',5'-cyclic AMP phosphodiesterase CpdA